jgi:two-component system, cell cycle sensor histidine kinase and response regulator CckA
MVTDTSQPTYARPSLQRAHDDPADRQFRRRLRLYQELTVRGGVALVIVAFQLVFPVEPPAFSRCISLLALLGLFLNGPYFLAARNGQAFRAQAYVRMLIDVLLLSVGLYFAGGIAAAHFVGVYLIVMIYAGITFSTRACLTATAAATASYITIVSLQQAGILSAPFDLPNATMIAAFNLILLNIAGALTAVLARALRESRRRLRSTYQELERFVEAIPDVIYVVDRAGRLTLWNQKLESVTGRVGETLKGELLLDLLAEDDRTAFGAALTAGLENRPFEVEGRLRGADGVPIAYQWTGAPLTDERGQVSGLTGVGRDVTERKRADDILRQRESEMRQLQKIEAIGRLAGGVAHDFNNVLTVVIGRCQLMLSRYQPGDPAYQDLDQIETTAQRAAGLTRQLLAFSRNQASARQPLDLNATVTSVSDMLARLIGENIELEVQLDPKLDLVMADPGQIEQVIVNFAVNARDAMPSGGRLTIRTTNIMLKDAFVSAHPAATVGPHVLLEVRDSGTGMDEATLQRAFEPFFTTKAPGKGCGLGLSTVYGIVKQHEGYTAVESEPGHGATFRVYLPRIEAPVEAPRGGNGRGPLPGGEETILLVEDEEAVRSLVREILSRLGYRVLVASEGLEALALSQRFPERIHLLLTDVIMPGMDGRELAERMMVVRPDTRILFMSGYAEPPIPDDVLLQKPVTPDALARKVAEVLHHPALAG